MSLGKLRVDCEPPGTAAGSMNGNSMRTPQKTQMKKSEGSYYTKQTDTSVGSASSPITLLQRTSRTI